ncbi:MAG: GNAT family N-acetyltransferase [Actinobacteria bacterium]|nr:GNAT family N-acetyltransferase [Actinomycetota bacterium]
MLRPATPGDFGAIAALHTDSWRRNYRGALSDAFLDGPIEAERLAPWAERLARPGDGTVTTVAVDGDGSITGFVHTIFDADPADGALLENLHVRDSGKRAGLGTQLMASSAKAVLARPSPTGLYLTVLVQNTAAQAFYEARGGTRAGEEPWDAPDGSGGSTLVYRYTWPDPGVLL